MTGPGILEGAGMHLVRELPRIGDQVMVTVTTAKESYSSAVVKVLAGPFEFESAVFGVQESTTVYIGKIRRGWRWGPKKKVFIRYRPTAFDERDPGGNSTENHIVGYFVNAH